MIFISYQHDSLAFALELRERLDNHEPPLTSFIDLNLKAGERWKKIIDANLDECVAVIVIVTHKALKSPYVTYEWSYALGQHKVVIPLILELPDPKKKSHPKLHPQIGDIHYLDFQAPDEDRWKTLLDRLTFIIQKEHIPYEVRQAMLEAASTNPATRKNAFQALLQHEDDVDSASHALRELVRSNFAEVSIEAAFALCQKSHYTDEHALVGLRRGLRSGDFQLFKGTIDTLVGMKSDAAVECLGEALTRLQPEDTTHEKPLVEALCLFNTMAAVQELIKVEARGGTKWTAIIDALGRFGDPIGLPVLINRRRLFAGNDRAYENHQLTIRAIGKIDHPDAIAELVQVIRENARRVDNWQQLYFNAARDQLVKLWSQDVIDMLKAHTKPAQHPPDAYTAAVYEIIRSMPAPG